MSQEEEIFMVDAKRDWNKLVPTSDDEMETLVYELRKTIKVYDGGLDMRFNFEEREAFEWYNDSIQEIKKRILACGSDIKCLFTLQKDGWRWISWTSVK